MLMKLLKVLFYGGADPEDYKRIEKHLWEENRKNLIRFCDVLLLILLGMCFISNDSDKYTSNFLIFFAIDVIATAVILALLIFLPAKKPIVAIGLDSTFLLVFGSAIYMSCVLENNRASVSFMVFLIFLPEIVYLRPISLILRILVAIGFFVYFNMEYCSGRVLYVNLINATIFGILVIVFSTFTSKGNIERYLNEYKLRCIGDMDFLTGLNNRNSYERNLKDYEQNCNKELICIYIDLNGLHTLNNSEGHEAGDKAIRRVADELKQSFRQNDIYRIGGDEFVLFVADADYNDVLNRIEKCRESLSEDNVYISYGVKNRTKSELDVSNLVKEAEKLMYEAKETFYDERGLMHR